MSSHMGEKKRMSKSKWTEMLYRCNWVLVGVSWPIWPLEIQGQNGAASCLTFKPKLSIKTSPLEERERSMRDGIVHLLPWHCLFLSYETLGCFGSWSIRLKTLARFLHFVKKMLVVLAHAKPGCCMWLWRCSGWSRETCLFGSGLFFNLSLWDAFDSFPNARWKRRFSWASHIIVPLMSGVSCVLRFRPVTFS